MSISMTRAPCFFKAVSLNAAFSTLCGGLMSVIPVQVSQWLGVDQAALIRGLGLFLLLFAARLVMIRLQKRIEPAEAWMIIFGDLGWVAGSAIVMVMFAGSLSLVGQLLIGGTAAMVLLFALLQRRGLKIMETAAAH